MYLSRKLAYNKKKAFSFVESECLPNYMPMALNLATLILTNECHLFITIIIIIMRNKMIAMSFKTFIIKVFIFILSLLLSIRDSVDTQTTNASYI